MSRKCKHIHKSKIAYYHIGETSIHKNGQLMKIIDYIDYDHVIVQFEDDFVINISYDKFQRGNFKKYFKNPIGLTNIASNNMKIEIINYNGPHDIDVKFEDGAIHYHTCLSNFWTGKIAHPSIYEETTKLVGEINTAKNGQLMTIIDSSNGPNDITIKFQDNTVVYHKKYKNFVNGNITNPNYTFNQYLNDTKYSGNVIHITKSGLHYKILKFHNSKKITIQFIEDNYITDITSSTHYSKNISHPDHNTRLLKTRSEYLGKTFLNKSNGLKMTVIDVIDGHDMTVQFETGYIKEHKYGLDIKNGKVKHKFPYQMENIILEKLAYVHNDIGNFYCKCSKCNHKDIWTIEEAKNHKCEEITND